MSTKTKIFRGNTSDLCHKFAHEPYGSDLQGESGGSSSFYGNYFKSYSAVIGVKLPPINNSSIDYILVNNHRYSTTTAKTQHKLRFAVPNERLIQVDIPDSLMQDIVWTKQPEHAELMVKLYKDECEKLLTYIRETKKTILDKRQYVMWQIVNLSSLQRYLSEVEYLAVVSEQENPELYRLMNNLDIDDFSEYLMTEQEVTEKREARNSGKTSREQARIAERIRQFKIGAPILSPVVVENQYALLRIDPKNREFVETSKQVRIPKKVVANLYQVWQTKPEALIGMRVEGTHYFINIVTEEAIICGCHTIRKQDLTEDFINELTK